MVKIAQRYANNAWVIGYDLLNEPVSSTASPWATQDNTPIRTIYMQITAALRKAGDKKLIFAEAGFYGMNFKDVTPPWDPNIVYTYHFYPLPANVGFFSGGDTKPSFDPVFALDVPMWTGETGETSTVSQIASLVAFNKTANRGHAIGWNWWTTKKVIFPDMPPTDAQDATLGVYPSRRIQRARRELGGSTSVPGRCQAGAHEDDRSSQDIKLYLSRPIVAALGARREGARGRLPLFGAAPMRYGGEMPYVKPEHRTVLDPAISELAARIADLAKSMPEETAFAGLLNYACTSIAMQVIDVRFGRLRYGIIATVTGVFNNVADEFYRRLAVPYENRQIAANGDVPLYETYAKRIQDDT